jgi:hypothetical protein
MMQIKDVTNMIYIAAFILVGALLYLLIEIKEWMDF